MPQDSFEILNFKSKQSLKICSSPSPQLRRPTFSLQPRRPLAAPPCLLLPSRAARSPAPAVQPVAPPQPRRPPSCPRRAARPPVASPLRRRPCESGMRSFILERHGICGPSEEAVSSGKTTASGS
ncbi:hypothetical protein PVAP13_2KG184000 [Panicum virgatum]|uniref:Uncharacterized protein n=1 Tax=Panicum virgatum TaxID=38727 RepID=A0A8T0W839_PANVG|nr:hypothetical protein PVAP13_2KG184000 [Panicum virgatum]